MEGGQSMGNGAAVTKLLDSEVEHVPHQLRQEEVHHVLDLLLRTALVLLLLVVQVDKLKFRYYI